MKKLKSRLVSLVAAAAISLSAVSVAHADPASDAETFMDERRLALDGECAPYYAQSCTDSYWSFYYNAIYPEWARMNGEINSWWCWLYKGYEPAAAEYEENQYSLYTILLTDIWFEAGW